MAKVFYHPQALECIARNILNEYEHGYLNQPPQAVPIENIIEDMYGITIEYMRLRESGEELGRMIYDDGYSYRFFPETDRYELVVVKKGMMLIETGLVENHQYRGRYRFTLAHELAHWVLHQKVFTGTWTAAASHKADKVKDNSVEWQANYLAKALLMPVGQVKRAFYDTKTTDKDTALAKIFDVSKQAMQIRLNELGLA
jgi:hypothetical protein